LIEIKKEDKMRRFGYFVLGVGMGGLICSLLVLLFTPASGEDLRGKLSSKSQKVVEDVRQAALRRRVELEQELARLRAPSQQ
jgi:gas vesicle protein